MKFAFSTESCPEWDFPTIAEKARHYRYDGVEISGANDAGQASARLTRDDALRNRQVSDLFTAAGIEIACIAAPIRCSEASGTTDAQELRQWIDLAAELSCPRVMIRDPEPRRGMSGLAIGSALGEWLAPIADRALARGVIVLVCNDATLTTARLMWTALERLCHPAVACCWDLHNASRAGESPAVSVPTLNSRIRYARVDAREPMSGSDVQLFLTRLRGIGYDGYVTAAGHGIGLDPSVIAGSGLPPFHGPDQYLRDMMAILRSSGTHAPSTAAARHKKETRPKAG